MRTIKIISSIALFFSLVSFVINLRLNDLIDVSIVNPQKGDILTWNGYGWTNDTLLREPPSDITGPVLLSAVIGPNDDSTIVLVYNEPLDEASIPATTDFSLSGGVSVSSVDISNDTVFVISATPYTSDSTITISYTVGLNPIQDVLGNYAGNLSGQAVTNNLEGIVSIAFDSLVTMSFSDPDYCGSCGAAFCGYGFCTKKMPAGEESYAIISMGSNPTNTGALLAVTTTKQNHSAFDSNQAMIFWSSGSLQFNTRESATTYNSGVNATVGDWYRLRRQVSGTVTAEYSSNSGGSWTLIKTFTFSSTADLWIQIRTSTTRCVGSPMGFNLVDR